MLSGKIPVISVVFHVLLEKYSIVTLSAVSSDGMIYCIEREFLTMFRGENNATGIVLASSRTKRTMPPCKKATARPHLAIRLKASKTVNLLSKTALNVSPRLCQIRSKYNKASKSMRLSSSFAPYSAFKTSASAHAIELVGTAADQPFSEDHTGNLRVTTQFNNLEER